MTGVASVTPFYVGFKMIEDWKSKDERWGEVDYHIDQKSFEKEFWDIPFSDFRFTEKGLDLNESTPTINKLIKDLSLLKPSLLIIRPKSVFSWYKTDCRRIIVPILTDDKCRITIESKAFVPNTFKVYWLNTFKFHAIFNGDDSNDKMYMVGRLPAESEEQDWSVDIRGKSKPPARYIFQESI